MARTILFIIDRLKGVIQMMQFVASFSTLKKAYDFSRFCAKLGSFGGISCFGIHSTGGSHTALFDFDVYCKVTDIPLSYALSDRMSTELEVVAMLYSRFCFGRCRNRTNHNNRTKRKTAKVEEKLPHATKLSEGGYGSNRNPKWDSSKDHL